MTLAIIFPKVTSLLPGSSYLQDLQTKCLWLQQEKDVIQFPRSKTIAKDVFLRLSTQKMQREAYHQWIQQCLKKLNAEGFNWPRMIRAKRWPFLMVSHDTLLFYGVKFLPDILKGSNRQLPRLVTGMTSAVKQEESLAMVSAFQQAVNQARVALVEAMLQRLEALAASDFVHANPLVTVMQQLPAATYHSAYDSEVIKPYLLPLTSNQFIQYERAIEHYGSPDQQRRFNQFPWRKMRALKNHPYFPLTTRGRGKKQFLIPLSFEKRVPRFRLWPNWLFKGHNFRYDFFKRQRYFLIQCLTLVDHIAIKKQGSLTTVEAKHWVARIKTLIGQMDQQCKALHLKSSQSKDWRGITAFKTQWFKVVQRHRSQLASLLLLVAEQTAKTTEKNCINQDTPNFYALDYAKKILKEQECRLQVEGLQQKVNRAIDPEERITESICGVLDEKTSPNGHPHDGRFRYLTLRLAANKFLTHQETYFFRQYVFHLTPLGCAKVLYWFAARPQLFQRLCHVHFDKLARGPEQPLVFLSLLTWSRQVSAFTALMNIKDAYAGKEATPAILLGVLRFVEHLTHSDLTKRSECKVLCRWLDALLPLAKVILAQEPTLYQALTHCRATLKHAVIPGQQHIFLQRIASHSLLIKAYLARWYFRQDIARIQQAIDTHWQAKDPLVIPHMKDIQQAVKQGEAYPASLSKSFSVLCQQEAISNPDFSHWLKLQNLVSILQQQGIQPLQQSNSQTLMLLHHLNHQVKKLRLKLECHESELVFDNDIYWSDILKNKGTRQASIPQPGVSTPCLS